MSAEPPKRPPSRWPMLRGKELVLGHFWGADCEKPAKIVVKIGEKRCSENLF
jgi:hypothetical protein